MPHLPYRVTSYPHPASGTAESFDPFILYQIVKQVILNFASFVIFIDHPYRHNHILLHANSMSLDPVRNYAYNLTYLMWADHPANM